MKPDSTTTRFQPRPLSRRNKWTVGGAIASLALVLATGAAHPAGASVQSPRDHVSASVRAESTEMCDSPAARNPMMHGDNDCRHAGFGLQRFDGPTVTVPAGGFASSTALCPAGYEAISGGFTSSQAVFVTPAAAYRKEGSPEGWIVFGTNSNAQNGLIKAFVYCDAR
ncbi:hypothetical protein [Streptomyces sp. NPDC003710]